MKYVKRLGLAAVAAAALMAFVGSSTASATVLCKVEGTGTTTGTTCPSGFAYPAGTQIRTSLVTGTILRLETEYKTIECKKSEISSETNAEEAEEITGPEGTFTDSECNCEVKVLKAGTIRTRWISGTHNGTLLTTGSETTTTCSTIFGNVHCIYITNNTDIGTRTGGSPAKDDIHVETLLLSTNSLCAKRALWIAEYEVTSPKPLYITGHT